MNEKKTILIVDDLQINRTLFTEILRGEYDIITACDGQEALSVLEKRGEKINLALIDMKMPVMDGFTLLCAMRANEKLKEIPAIIITASDEEQNEIKALDKGATDYLSKPVQPQIMRKRISAAIDRVELEKIKCENRRLEDEEAHKKAMELVLENIDCGVALFESQNGKINISYVNDRVCEFIGKERDDYLKEMQRDIFTFVHPEDVFRIRAILDMNLPVGQEVKEPIRVIRQNGEYKWVMLSAKKSGEENGTIKYIATYKNADEEVKSREELRYRADHDELTGIYNKNAFIHATERYLKKFPDIEFVLIRMNIERFKVLNDVFGIAVGDGLLRTIADGLRSDIGKNGTFGRLERDHFAVCMPKSMLDFDKLSTLAERLWKIGGMEYVIVINFGIYEINNDDISVEQMCDRANLAISTIKGNYEKHYAYYDERLRNSLLREQEIRSEMHAALRHHDFVVYLQPVFSLSRRSPVSAEALVRWKHPNKGLIAPNEFIPLFEKTGFISELDNYVWHEACHILCERRDKGLAQLPISVNASRRSLLNPNLAGEIHALTAMHDISPELLRIEVTESAYTSNPEQLLENIEKLRYYGFPIMMDDFGSGYSSLNTLKDIPVDVLKIDMKFLQGFEKGGRGGTILTSVVRMAKWMGVSVVAEGVETAEQVEFLRSIGCEAVQGFFYARPMPVDEFESFIINSSPEEYGDDILRTVDDSEIDMLMGGSHLVNRLLSSVFGGIAFYEYTEGRLDVLRVNAAYYEIMGLTPATLSRKGNNILEMISETEREICEGAVKQAISEKKEQRFTLKRLRGDGKTVYLDCLVQHIGGEDGRAVVCIAFADVSAQKEAELAVFTQKEDEKKRYSILNENAARLLEQTDMAGAINDSLRSLLDYYNASRAYIFEFDWEKGETSNTYEQCAENIRPEKDNLQNLPMETVEMWTETFKTKPGLFIEDIDALSDDDVAKYILQAQGIRSLLSVPLYNQSRMIGFIGVDDPDVNVSDTDILSTVGFYIMNEINKRERLVEEKRRQLLLEASVAKERETMDRYRLIVDRSGLAVFEWNSETRELYTSPSLENYAVSALEPRESIIVESAVREAIHPDDADVLKEFFAQCKKRVPSTEAVMRMRMKNGEYRWTRIRLILLRGKNNLHLERAIGTLLDIEDEIEAKSAMEQANERLSKVLDELPGGIGIYEVTGRKIKTIYLNDSYFSLFGESREDRPYIFEDGGALQAVYSGDIDAIFAELEAADREGRNADLNFRVLNKGHYKWINAKATQVGKNGDTIRYHLVFSDEDAKYRAMLDLQESQMALPAAIEISGIITWNYDLDSGEMSFNEANLTNCHLHPPQLDALWDAERETGVLPAYHEEYRRMIETLKDGAENVTADLEFREAPGEEPRWMRVVYKKMAGEENRALGIAIDIGEQKRIEKRYNDECAYHEALTGSVRAAIRYNVTKDEIEAVINNSELLKKVKDPDRLESYRSGIARMIADLEEREKFQEIFTREKMLALFEKGDHHRKLEVRISGHKGKTIWERVSIDLVRNAGDELMAFITARDVSSERHAELMISTAVARDFDYIGYIDYNADEYYFIRNEDSKAYLPDTHGHGIAKLLESNVFAHTGKEARELLAPERIFAMLETEDYYDVFSTIIQSDDSLARKHKRISYIDKERRILLITGKDVTEQYRREQKEQLALSNALRDANIASKAKTDFLARMSHDLRTPMNAIIGIAALAQSSTGDAQAMDDALRQIRMACDFLLGIVSDILDISDIERDEFVLHPQAYYYDDFIEDIKVMMLPLCREKNIRFNIVSSDDNRTGIYVDRTRFEQVFFNLLSNAIKFTPPGGEVDLAVNNGEIKDGKLDCEFVIRDNGIGMSEEFQKHMFESFARESKLITSEYAGSGLGLPIARRIVESMGGTLSIKSKKDEGTTATVRMSIPLAVETAEKREETNEEEVSRKLWGSRILLVEDNETNSRIVCALLRQKGVSVEPVFNGQEAVESFLTSEPGHFDAVLMDIRMPIMDGWEASSLIRALPRADAKNVPIIALSANAFTADVQRSHESGMQAHLAKPINPPKLYATLAKYMARRGAVLDSEDCAK